MYHQEFCGLWPQCSKDVMPEHIVAKLFDGSDHLCFYWRACKPYRKKKKNVNHKLRITATARYGKSLGMVIQRGASH